MSFLRSPKKPDLPAEPEPVEDVAVIEEDAEVAARKRKKKILRGGRRGTIISGIQAALLKRKLGE
ncbi:hypothetical protein LCGC14_1781490 [marine sediment metagenome]|uniref:Uncharacterized protein n=1 Tax=marine sediment metagenome TaxID=412755 RepID=A0A0F9JA72_9ZZZZ